MGRTWLKRVDVRKMSPTESAWLAGMIDGEGTICLTAGGRGGKYAQLILAVYNNHKPTVEWCQKLAGTGSVSMKPMRGRLNPSYQWRVTSQRAVIGVLRQSVPFMVTKKDKAVALLDSWQDIVDP